MFHFVSLIMHDSLLIMKLYKPIIPLFIERFSIGPLGINNGLVVLAI